MDIVTIGSADLKEIPTDSLIDANVIKAQFFALLSHDMRSALAGARGSLFLLSQMELSKDAVLQVERADAAAHHLEDLLATAFEAAKNPETIGDAPDIECNLAVEMDRLVNYWGGYSVETGTDFQCAVFDDASNAIVASRIGLHRIVNNVLNNAFKYAAGGKIKLECTVDGPRHFEIRIQDSGPGFSDEALNKMFSFGGRPINSKKDGSGMGMFIAKSFVEGMNGQIFAENADESGAVVRVRLPMSIAAKASSPARTLPDLSHLHILLAEDNKTNQMVVTQMLTALNATYSLASDGVEAVELFGKEDFDLALLDIEMPRMSGLEVMRVIRAGDGVKAKIPIAALTAYVMPEHRQKIFEAGAQSIIAKPIQGIAELGNEILAVDGIRRPPGNTDEFDLGEVDMVIFEELRVAMGPETMSELAEKLAEDLQRVRDQLALAIEPIDRDSIRANSHILVSIAGVIGAVNLQKLAEKVNSAAKIDCDKNLSELASQCVCGVDRIQTFVRKLKNK